MTSLTDIIAGFAATPATSIPASARAVARLSLLDWAAVALAGLAEPVATIVRAMVAEEGGAAQATVFGLSARHPARAAALANGALSHALDYDDTHFAYVGHPSVAMFPAALAAAEREGVSAAEMLDAALIGMEAACRIGAWLGTRHYNHGFHQTATSGAFGATVAAARLMRLGREQTRHALGLAATRASGLKSQFGTMGKPFNAGIAASNGVEAALLARAGFISRPDGLECEQGFGMTHNGEANDLDTVTAGLGATFWFEAVQHKFHACCHGLHAMLEAIAEIRAAEPLDPARIDSITIHTNPRWLRVCNNPSPTTGLEAKFSYRLTAAMAVSGVDTAALATYTDAICAVPALVDLRDRVIVTPDTAIGDTATRVVIVLKDGARRVSTFDLDTPLPLDAREKRLKGKLAALLGTERAGRLARLEIDSGGLPARSLAQAIAGLA